MDDLLADFLTETNESIAELDVALVKLERTPDDADTLSLIFRLVHTIKGTCGFLGLPRLERVAHAAENVLGKVRDGALTATPDTVTLVLAALDRIKAIVDRAGGHRQRAGRRRRRADRRAERRAAGRGAEARPPPLPPEPEPEPAPEAVAAPVRRRCRHRRPHRLRRRSAGGTEATATASRSPPTRPSASPSMCWKT